jgi:hypothetical protein
MKLRWRSRFSWLRHSSQWLALRLSITRHASDFVLARRWNTLHIWGDMKPSPWIFRRSTNFLQEWIKKSNNFFFSDWHPALAFVKAWTTLCSLVVVFLLVPCQLQMYSNPSSGNVCKSLHLPLNGRNHNPSVCSSVRPELHPECERLKATERAPWTIDASVCDHEAAMAAFTWPRLGRGLLCFSAVWRDAYATPIALLCIFLMPVAGEEELAVLNSFWSEQA